MTTTEDPEVTIPAPRSSPEDTAADNAPPGQRGWRRRLTALCRAVRLPAVPRRWPGRRVVAGAVVVVLLLVGGGFRYAGHRLRDPGATGNRALTDTEATNQVTGDVSNTLGKIFAYTPDSTQATAQAARDLLDGSAATQYQALFGQIRQRVAEQQLTLTTRVVRAGVASLTSGQARLLVFLDQTAQRAGAPASSAAAQLSVTAHLTRGHWRITDLKAR